MCGLCDLANTGLSRRLFLGGAAALASASTLRAAPVGENAPNAIPPDEAFARLVAGNQRYSTNKSTNLDYSVGRAERANAQYPIAAILSCADSRVAPELVFDQGPGQLFVVRVAGNFVSVDGLASLEYAVQFLGVPLIAVMGHTGCGAIAAAIKVLQEGAKLPGHLPDLIADIEPSVHAAMKQHPANLLEAATVENVRLNVADLSRDQPVVASAVKRGKVKVVGGIYDIATGRVNLI